MLYKITPVAKCRMTQRDKFLNPPRPCVRKYLDFKAEIELHCVALPCSDGRVIFYLPMPSNWTDVAKAEMNHKPYVEKRKNDVDNLLKTLMDAIFEDDSKVWDIRITKVWSYDGAIEILTNEEKSKYLYTN